MRPKEEMAIIKSEIHKLLNTGVIEVCTPVADQILSSVFFLTKLDSTLRTIFNMKPLNQVIKYRHFKMDTFETALNLIRPSCWLASIDLQSAYYVIPVAVRIESTCASQLLARFISFGPCQWD